MKQRISVVVLFFILMICDNCIASGTVYEKKETLKESRIDTIVIIKSNIDDDILKNYSQILEKTNSQLSLWYNPYGIFISMLGVLFTLFAIIVAFVLFRQSKEYKELIRISIEDHKLALDNLIQEKEIQIKNLELSIDKTISDYSMKLSEAGDTQKAQIEKFLEELEGQKEFLSSHIQTYKHSGWEFKDIQTNYPINQYSRFYVKIVLQPKQLFTIYIRVKTKNNKLVWIGFTGNSSEKLPLKTKDEYKVDIGGSTNTELVIMNENIFKYFNLGFSELRTEPIEVVCIRLRASDENKSEITFSYRIS